MTPKIQDYLRRSGVTTPDPAKLAVFEATAVNTLPLRKRHPLYKDARIDPTVLYEMSAELMKESLPVQIMHDSDILPVGRVFHGEVLPMDNSGDFELRTLFFISASETETIAKIEDGTVDQVSVSILTKQALNSVSGFDYFGDESTFENIFSGDDGDGNVLGEKGVFAKLIGLDSFYELSLVNSGGAQKARIVHRDQSHFGSSYQKLAASGVDPNAFILAASIEEPKMDLKELVASLTEKGVELSKATDKVTELTANVTTLTAARDELETKVTDLETEVAALKAASEGQEDLEAVKTELSGALESLKSVATALLVANGKTADNLPETAVELSTLIEDQKTSLAAVLLVGGRGHSADRRDVAEESIDSSASAYRVKRR